MIINPIVEIGRYINARRVDEDNIVTQQAATFAWPKDAHQTALAKLLLAQRIRQLFNILKKKLVKLEIEPKGITKSHTYHHVELLVGALLH